MVFRLLNRSLRHWSYCTEFRGDFYAFAA